MNLLLSERIPLRSTKALGDYAEDVFLPEVFGDLTSAPFPLIRLSPTRYFAADHPMRVTKVFTAKQVTEDWAGVLESDDLGRTWTEVHFGAPIPLDTPVAACGIGRSDDRTGALISNPADVLRRGTQLAGRSEDWTALRAECSALDLRIAGRISDPLKVRELYLEVTTSIGAIYAPGMARLYPSSAEPTPVLDLVRDEVSEIRVSTSLADTADILRLAYDRSDATGRALHYIELTASPQRYGGLVKEVVYPWLRSPKDAEAIGRPVLQRLAGERYDVSLASTRKSIRPGDWIRLVAHPEWPLPGADPVIMVLAVELEPKSDSVAITGETIIGEASVVVTAHSIALPDSTEASIDVAVRDGVATFTIHDSDGRPIAGARVSLDGGAPKTTNAQGKASFPVIAGVHELSVEAAGFVPFRVLVTL